MDKKKIAALMIPIFFFMLPVCSAYIELEMHDVEKTVYLGDEVSFDFTVKNLMALRETVLIDVKGEPSEWIGDFTYMLFVPGRQGTVNSSANFFPSGEIPGTYHYTITASSYKDNYSSSGMVTINVLRPLDIEDFTASKTGDDLFLNVLLISNKPTNAEMSFVITNGKGEFVSRFSLNARINGLTMVEESVPLPDDLLAGDYNVEVSLVGTPVKRNYMFTVLPVHMVTENIKKTSTTFQDDFEVTIVNEGNIKEIQYVTYKTVPNNDWVTGFITEPDECFSRNGLENTCKYVIYDLAPGETVTLDYTLDYMPIYAALGLVLVVVFMLVFFGMRRVTAPVIIKRHVRKSGGRHEVVLEVKNPFYHNLSNAIVRDWVTPLANVLHHEISAVKPLIRRSDAGTELIWKLGDIKPKETRIITYPLKALVNGSLKMPKAYIRYNKPNGKLRRLFSRNLIIEA